MLTAGSGPTILTRGPDGALWFTEQLASPGRVGRISVAGAVTEYPLPGNNPIGITAAGDSNLYAVESVSNKIARITTAGLVTEYPIPTAGALPFAITPGSDNELYFTEASGNKIGRFAFF